MICHLVKGMKLLKNEFAKGDLAPTTVLFESESEITEETQASLVEQLLQQDLVSTVRATGISEDGLAAQFQLTFRGKSIFNGVDGCS